MAAVKARADDTRSAKAVTGAPDGHVPVPPRSGIDSPCSSSSTTSESKNTTVFGSALSSPDSACSGDIRGRGRTEARAAGKQATAGVVDGHSAVNEKDRDEACSAADAAGASCPADDGADSTAAAAGAAGSDNDNGGGGDSLARTRHLIDINEYTRRKKMCSSDSKKASMERVLLVRLMGRNGVSEVLTHVRCIYI